MNYIYALYLQPGVAADIDAWITSNSRQSPRHNTQGQHYADDVLNYFQFDRMLNEHGGQYTEQHRLRQQITDPSNALEVMQLADTFNDNHKGLVAYVAKSGSQYDVYVKERDSSSQHNITFLKERLNAWHAYEDAFQNVGIDINAVPDVIKGIVNPYQVNLVGYLMSLQNTSHRNMYKKDAMVLFELGCTPAWKNILESMFGSLEAAAEAVDTINSGGAGAASITNHQKQRLINAINSAKSFLGVDLQNLESQVQQRTQ